MENGSEDCSVCLEDLGSVYTRLSCGHKFHRACLNEWRKTNQGHRCPLCRKVPVAVETYVKRMKNAVQRKRRNAAKVAESYCGKHSRPTAKFLREVIESGKTVLNAEDFQKITVDCECLPGYTEIEGECIYQIGSNDQDLMSFS